MGCPLNTKTGGTAPRFGSAAASCTLLRPAYVTPTRQQRNMHSHVELQFSSLSSTSVIPSLQQPMYTMECSCPAHKALGAKLLGTTTFESGIYSIIELASSADNAPGVKLY